MRILESKTLAFAASALLLAATTATIALADLDEGDGFEHFHRPYNVRSSPEKDEALLRAIRNDNASEVRRLIDSGANPFRSHALHEATRFGHCKALPELLRAGVDPNTADSYGSRPLYQSIQRWSPDCAHALLADPRTEPDVTDGDGTMPVLHWALLTDQPDVFEHLLARGADPDFRGRRGDTALHFALRLRKYAQLETLLKHGADPNALDHADYAPLDRAEEHPDSYALIRNAGGRHSAKHKAREERDRPLRFRR